MSETKQPVLIIDLWFSKLNSQIAELKLSNASNKQINNLIKRENIKRREECLTLNNG